MKGGALLSLFDARGRGWASRPRAALRIGPLAVMLAVLGCTERPWDLERLERRHPGLRALGSHRLAGVTPYYLPVAGGLTLFLCRWPDGAVVPVSLPPGATPDERRKLEAALAAWEGALGLRFERRAPSGAGIEIRLLDDMLAYSASTGADCAVDAKALGSGAPQGLPARLVFASIDLARGDPRLAGSALHELGHALGFQGHASRGNTVMVTSTDAIRRAGERVIAGEAFDDAAVGALYAVPSGTVLRRLPLARRRTAPVDRLLAIAARLGLRGPLVRVGDEEGYVAWRDARGRVVSVRVAGLRQALHDPARLVIEPSPRAQRLLEGSW